MPSPSLWVGRFDCLDCTAIELHLRLSDDGSYAFGQVFLGTPEGDKNFTAEGSWETSRGIPDDAEAVVVRLAASDAAPVRMLLMVDGGEALELLDATGHRLADPSAGRLERQHEP